MTLQNVNANSVVEIVDITSSSLKTRLMGMGFIEGTKIEVLPSSPFGDPMMLKIRSYNVALRKQDAAMIHVTPVTN